MTARPPSPPPGRGEKSKDSIYSPSGGEDLGLGGVGDIRKGNGGVTVGAGAAVGVALVIGVVADVARLHLVRVRQHRLRRHQGSPLLGRGMRALVPGPHWLHQVGLQGDRAAVPP